MARARGAAPSGRVTGFEVEVTLALPTFQLRASCARQARVLALQGPSGAGKSTLLNIVAGLVPAAQGRVAIGGAVLADSGRGVACPPHRRRVGYVFQEARLLPHLSVARNLRYGRWFAAEKPTAAEEAEIVELLGLHPVLRRRPGTLSGGERMRVAIGRALMSRPRVLLMDEPLAAVDEARRETLLRMIEAVRDRTGTPIVYVSHNQGEVRRLADTVIEVSAGRAG